ncbi:AMP-binding protein [Paucibacter sp. R3-3]|uniref:AMP-binding protein n=1 Tax=Roseateles agri TaxID=3098619 RepID=A0ABU5DP05_9BURK|nr:AMP-binding protein [Paucibacter sp. R3-3]MDY0748042.1 AMP-binding protein [Paucibacter sp. R3-3]
METSDIQDASARIQIKGRSARWHDMPALLRDKARVHGPRILTVIDGRPLAYNELDRLSDLVAGHLHALGVREGACVASLMFNCVEQVLGWFGTNKLGAVWAPLNASLTGDDLIYTLRDTGAKVLIVDAENAGKVASLPAEMLSGLTVFVGPPAQPAAPIRSFQDLLKPTTPPPRPELRPGSPALILYSGGTTGMPKGVVMPHFAFICAGYRYGEVLQTTPEDCHYTTLPMFHGSGTQFGIIGPMLNDMTSVMDRRFSVSSYWERVRQAGATIVDPIGTMMTVLTQAPESPNDRNHKVRISTGVNGQVPEWVPARFIERFGIQVVDIYGSTESGGAMLVSNQLGSQVEGAVGHPNGWSQIAILDANDNPVPPGVVGEIGMRPTVPFSFMLGYHNNPAKSVEAWRNLWLHTGDLGRVDEAGNLFFVGRQVHWLRRRGENISAYEIEDIVSRHPGVEECIAVGVPAELGEEDVKIFVIARDPTLSHSEIIDWCMSKMAAFKVPRYVAFVDDFPRSATKREVERNKVKAMQIPDAWDREVHMGRLSTQSRGN